MSAGVLVDISVWSLALRRKAHELGPEEAEIATELTELITAGRARLIGMVRQELLSGIKTPEQYEKLRKILLAYPDEPVNIEDFEAAAKAHNQCRAHGSSARPLTFAFARFRCAATGQSSRRIAISDATPKCFP